MFKFRNLLINAFFSALIGAVVEIVFIVTTGQESIRLWDLMESMAVGAVIGTVSMAYISVYVFKQKPTDSAIRIYLTNFLVVAAMFLLGIGYSYMRTGFFSHINKWLTGFLVAEILSYFLTMAWYKNMAALNRQLAKKKDSLTDE